MDGNIPAVSTSAFVAVSASAALPQVAAWTYLLASAPGLETIPTAKPKTASLHSRAWEYAEVACGCLYLRPCSHPRSAV